MAPARAHGATTGAPEGPRIPIRIVGIGVPYWGHDTPGTTGGLLPSPGLAKHYRANIYDDATSFSNALVRLRGGEAALPAFQAEYGPRGVAILTAVFQDPAGAPCDEAFARLWAQTFSLPFPVLIDTQFQTGAYFQANVMPANLFVDAETGEILLTATGAEPGADPLRAYRDFLDSHLAR